MDYVIEITSQEPQHAAVVSAQVPHDGIAAFIGQAFGQVMAAMASQGIDVVGPPFGRYDLAEGGFAIDAGFPSSRPVAEAGGVHDVELPGGEAATTMHVGGYEQVAGAYRALEAWMAEHGYAPTGAPWESYLDGPEVAEPRTIVTWPCRMVS